MASADLIRYTIESFAGSTDAAKRAAIFEQWKTVQRAVNSGVSSLSLPGLNGSLDPERQAAYLELLTECLRYLDGQIAEDPTVSAATPMGHTVNFACRPVIW